MNADEIRADIDEPRAATERYRAKAAELIAELRAREARSRGDAARAQAAAAEAEATLSQEAVKLQREADERVEAARRRAEQQVQEQLDRVRREALSGALPDEPNPEAAEEGSGQRIPDEAPAGEPAGTRYVGAAGCAPSSGARRPPAPRPPA